MDEVVYTEHARVVMEQRGISHDWVLKVLRQPAKTEPDPDDLELMHALGVIDAFGGRVLRVVYNSTSAPFKVVTAFFDRSMRGKL